MKFVMVNGRTPRQPSFLCAVPRVNRGELPARNCDAALLLQSRLLRRSQGARPSTPKSCGGVIIAPTLENDSCTLIPFFNRRPKLTPVLASNFDPF